MKEHLDVGRGFVLGCAALAVCLGVLLVGAGASQARAAVVHCGDIITRDTKLHNDLTDCPGSGLVVAAGGVTLDLHGHVIDGTGQGVGVAVGGEGRPGVDSVTIQGGAIREFGTGVGIIGSTDGHLRKLTITGNSRGIVLAGSPGATIERNRLRDNDQGISAEFGGSEQILRNVVSAGGLNVSFTHDATVSGNAVLGGGISAGEISSSRFDSNLISRSDTGLLISSATDNVVRRNALLGNQVGLSLSTFTKGNQITRNVVAANAQTGISLGHSLGDSQLSPNRVEENVLYGNGDGIIDSDDGSSVIARNGVFSSANGGISTGGLAQDFQILQNYVAHSGGDGILVSDLSVPGVIQGNVSRANGDDGIDVDAPMATLSGNRSATNADLGIEAIAGTIDGGGNRAFGNGNPLQCLNVACE